MQTYCLERFGSVDGIVLRERGDPTPRPTEIVVRIHAASLNRRDAQILHQTYLLPATPNVVPLSDGAGEVVAVGSRVTRFRIGDRVTGSYFPRWRDGRITMDLGDQLGCTLDGMLSDHTVLDEQWAVALPSHLTWEEAATLTCAGVTAWNAVVEAGAARAGQRVLVIGTGGVSLFALQFAKMMGCSVIGVTSEDGKAENLRSLGADHVVNYTKTPEWGQVVRDLTCGDGVDLVVETRGPDTIEQSLTASALHSRIVLLTTRSARGSTPTFPWQVYARGLVTLSRVFVGSRAHLEAMIKAIAATRSRPVIDRVFPFNRAREAYSYFLEGRVFGKVVILGR